MGGRDGGPPPCRVSAGAPRLGRPRKDLDDTMSIIWRGDAAAASVVPESSLGSTDALALSPPRASQRLSRFVLAGSVLGSPQDPAAPERWTPDGSSGSKGATSSSSSDSPATASRSMKRREFWLGHWVNVRWEPPRRARALELSPERRLRLECPREARPSLSSVRLECVEVPSLFEDIPRRESPLESICDPDTG